jgi:hypothetical protein
VDFFLVPDNQLEMHARLLNWARFIRPSWSPQQHPMWNKSISGRRGSSGGVDPMDGTDTGDGMKLEREVAKLPESHREAVRWYYVNVRGETLMAARRRMGVTVEGMVRLVNDGRLMLRNRGV